SMTDNSDSSKLCESNFASLLRRAGQKFGAHASLVHNGHKTSFAALNRRAAGISRGLQNAGVRPGDVCTVLARGPGDAACAFFSALGVGAIGINVNELYRPRQIEFVLTHSRAHAMLVSREVLDSLPR